MKNILSLILLSSVSIFANTSKQYEIKRFNKSKNKVESIGTRTPCRIVGDNTYKYCIDQGYSVILASSIANAAEAECIRVSKGTNSNIKH